MVYFWLCWATTHLIPLKSDLNVQSTDTTSSAFTIQIATCLGTTCHQKASCWVLNITLKRGGQTRIAMKLASFQWMCHVTSWEGKLAFPSFSRPLPLNPHCLCLQQLCSPRFHAMSFNHLWHMAYAVQSRYCLGQKLLHSYIFILSPVNMSKLWVYDNDNPCYSARIENHF